MDEREGEVERKVRELQEAVFEKYAEKNNQKDDDGNPYITRDQLRQFVLEIMEEAGEDVLEAFTEEQFDKGYSEFDQDGSGRIDASEFDGFVKRFADL